MHEVETYIFDAVQWLRLVVETLGALIVAVGVAVAIYYWAQALISRQPTSFGKIRLSFARYLALALEFQLGADILSTAIAPSWEQIGKLGAIAVIRTGLNYFLTLELREGAHKQEGTALELHDKHNKDPESGAASPAR